jgi:hypothetical protein
LKLVCGLFYDGAFLSNSDKLSLKSVFYQIQAAEKAGNISPKEKRKLEEQAAEKGIQALFKVCAPSS